MVVPVCVHSRARSIPSLASIVPPHSTIWTVSALLMAGCGEPNGSTSPPMDASSPALAHDASSELDASAPAPADAATSRDASVEADDEDGGRTPDSGPPEADTGTGECATGQQDSRTRYED